MPAKKKSVPVSNTNAFREEMRDTFLSMRDELKDIKVALVGNDTGTTGLVKRVDAIEKAQQIQMRLYWIGTGIVVAAGGIYTFVHDWFGK